MSAQPEVGRMKRLGSWRPFRSWLGPRCADCGRSYGDKYGFPDLVLDNESWRAISPSGDGGGLLCPSCICGRLQRAGVRPTRAVFRSGPLFDMEVTNG